MSALAERISTDQSTLSRAVMRMENNGWIQRRLSNQDSRAVEIRLTARGASLFNRILPVALELQRTALAGLTRPDLNTLSRCLTRIAGNMQR